MSQKESAVMNIFHTLSHPWERWWVRGCTDPTCFPGLLCPCLPTGCQTYWPCQPYNYRHRRDCGLFKFFTITPVILALLCELIKASEVVSSSDLAGLDAFNCRKNNRTDFILSSPLFSSFLHKPKWRFNISLHEQSCGVLNYTSRLRKGSEKCVSTDGFWCVIINIRNVCFLFKACLSGSSWLFVCIMHFPGVCNYYDSKGREQ